MLFLELRAARRVHAPRSIQVCSAPPSLVEDSSPKSSHRGMTSDHWVDHFLRQLLECDFIFNWGVHPFMLTRSLIYLVSFER